MGFDWETTLDEETEGVAEAYDQQASDALYQDHPNRAPRTPSCGPVDQGDEKLDLPFDEV